MLLCSGVPSGRTVEQPASGGIAKPVTVFCPVGPTAISPCYGLMKKLIYISADGKDFKLLLALEKHLKQLQPQGVSIWHGAHILAGADSWLERAHYLDQADIFLALVSADYVLSKICRNELSLALQMRAKNETVVIPILARPVILEMHELNSLQALPKDGQPLSKSRNCEDRLHEITNDIKQRINALQPSGKSTTIQSVPILDLAMPQAAPTQRVRITIEKEFECVEDLAEIVGRLKSICGEPCKFIKVEMGSIVLTMEVPPEVATRLSELWQSGRLTEALAVTVTELHLLADGLPANAAMPAMVTREPDHGGQIIPNTSASLNQVAEPSKQQRADPLEKWQEFIVHGGRLDQASLVRFIRDSGPIFLHAIRAARRYHIGIIDLPTEEDILVAIWENFCSNIDRIFQKFDLSRGTLTSYIYIYARSRTHDYIRQLYRKQDAEALASNSDSQEAVIENQESMTSNLMALFNADNSHSVQRMESGDWDLLHRFRHRLNAIMERMQKSRD